METPTNNSMRRAWLLAPSSEPMADRIAAWEQYNDAHTHLITVIAKTVDRSFWDDKNQLTVSGELHQGGNE